MLSTEQKLNRLDQKVDDILIILKVQFAMSQLERFARDRNMIAKENNLDIKVQSMLKQIDKSMREMHEIIQRDMPKLETIILKK